MPGRTALVPRSRRDIRRFVRQAEARAADARSPLAKNSGVLCQDGPVCGDELDDVEVPRKSLAHVPLGVEGSAEIAPCVPVVLDDNLTGIESLSLRIVHGVRARQPLRGDEHAAIWSEHPLELADPRKLERLGQMGEHGDRVDDVEGIAVVPERGLEPVRRDVRERQRVAAPLHELGVDIGAVYARGSELVPVAKDTAATATEVE